jgi:predicted TIM-barrel fold metal-dependent hydrolase
MLKKDMDIVLKEMDENNIGLGIFPVRKSWELISNDELLECEKTYNGRFKGVAGLEPFGSDGVLDLESCYKDIDDYVATKKLIGVALEPGLDRHPYYVDDKKLYPLFEKLQAVNAIVFISWGGLYNTEMSYYDPMKINRVAQNFPNMK